MTCARMEAKRPSSSKTTAVDRARMRLNIALITGSDLRQKNGSTIMYERHNSSQLNSETKLNNWGQ